MPEIAVFTRVDARVEPRLRELYARHREAARRIDWSYASLLPREQGRNFAREPWDPRQRRLDAPMYVAVETALRTAVNLPWFTASLDDVLRDVISTHLQADPNYVWPIARGLRDFDMPGHAMPDFKGRMRVIAAHAGDGPAGYFHQVVEAPVRCWDLEHLQPTLAETIASRHEIRMYERRLGHLADRRAGGRQHGTAPRERT